MEKVKYMKYLYVHSGTYARALPHAHAHVLYTRAQKKIGLFSSTMGKFYTAERREKDSRSASDEGLVGRTDSQGQIQ